MSEREGQGVESTPDAAESRARSFVVPAILALASLSIGSFVALRPGAGHALEQALSRLARRPWPEERLPAREALLLRQIQGLDTLLARAARGPLVPVGSGQAVVMVDQELVRSLLGALVPSERVVARRYRVRVASAAAAFEDGFALVRLDGRASLLGAESQVFADISVYGDLEVPRIQPASEVLQARINVVAVEARRVDLLVEARKAQALVEELGRTKLEEFAGLASPLQIPVRLQHTFELPALGPGGPVRIAAASVPFSLGVRDVTAFHGKLFISMAAGVHVPAATAPPPAPGPPRPERVLSPAGLPGLERAHRARHERLEGLVAADAFLRDAVGIDADLALAMRADFAQELIRDVAKRYLRRVDLRLNEIEVRKSGTVTRNGPLGRVRAGDWSLGLRIRDLEGVLRAGEPEVEFLDGNRVGFAFPVHLERGAGRARIAFAWDARGIVNLVCRDFEASPEIRATVVPEAYPMRGSFALAAAADSLTARPAFPGAFRIKLALPADSWDAVRAQLEAQDRPFKCGMVLDPEKVMGQLRRLVSAGFEVRIPGRIFRTVTLPVQVAGSVTVADHALGVSVTPGALRVSRELLWYGSSVSVRLPPSLRGRAERPEPARMPPSFSLLHAAHPARACGADRVADAHPLRGGG